MIVKLLPEHHLEFLSLKGGCIGSPESTHVKMPHCWKSHALAQIIVLWDGIYKYPLRKSRTMFFYRHFCGFNYHSFIVNVKIIYRTNEKCKQYTFHTTKSLPFHDMYFFTYRAQVSLSGQQWNLKTSSNNIILIDSAFGKNCTIYPDHFIVLH